MTALDVVPFGSSLFLILACTGHLLLGFAIGLLFVRVKAGATQRIAEVRENHASRTLSVAAEALDIAAISSDHIRQKIMALRELYTRQPGPAVPVVEALSALTVATSRLHEQLRSTATSCRKASDIRPRAAADRRPEDVLDGYNAQISKEQTARHPSADQSVLDEAIVLDELEPSRPDRYRYAAVQMLAPCRSDELPPAEAFCEVQCNDIGPQGVSFFLATPPDFQTFVITVGKQPDIKFLRGRVLHVAPSTAAAPSHLVECEFLGRLPPGDYTWDAKTGRVITNDLPESALSPKNRRILLVDDSSIDREIAQWALEHMGFSVSVAQHGLEAWDFLQTQPFDLVITDEIMPWMTGQQLCEKMREHHGLSDVPVILLTGLSDDLGAESLGPSGPNEILPKPFDPPHAQRLIESLLDRSTNGNKSIGAMVTT